MQLVSTRDLRGRPVITETGVRLGNLVDILIDPDQGRLMQLVVRPHLLGGAELQISAAAIIEIKLEAVVVKDALVKDGAAALA